MNSRRLTLDDLISQTRHHNANVRKDAYVGLLDLFNMHPHLLSFEVGNFFEYIVEGMIDTDVAPRNACLALFTNIFKTVEPVCSLSLSVCLSIMSLSLSLSFPLSLISTIPDFSQSLSLSLSRAHTLPLSITLPFSDDPCTLPPRLHALHMFGSLSYL